LLDRGGLAAPRRADDHIPGKIVERRALAARRRPQRPQRGRQFFLQRRFVRGAGVGSEVRRRGVGHQRGIALPAATQGQREINDEGRDRQRRQQQARDQRLEREKIARADQRAIGPEQRRQHQRRDQPGKC